MVQRLTSRPTIRRLLNQDRKWAVYALAILDDGMFELSEWWSCGDALALVYYGIRIRPIFLMGSSSEIRELLCAIPVKEGCLILQPHAVAAADGIYTYRQRDEMYRMILRDFTPRDGVAEPLTRNDRAEVQSLFSAGEGAGSAFAPAQMESGFYRGVREDGALIAVAGVHVVSNAESVAGVGNVAVRADRRGRGLAQTVVSATVGALLAAGIQTIGLNVEHSNAPAIRAYQKLGFRTECRYFEGMAVRLP